MRYMGEKVWNTAFNPIPSLLPLYLRPLWSHPLFIFPSQGSNAALQSPPPMLCCSPHWQGSNTAVRAAVSMCNPFDLTISNKNFEKVRVWDRLLV